MSQRHSCTLTLLAFAFMFKMSVHLYRCSSIIYDQKRLFLSLATFFTLGYLDIFHKGIFFIYEVSHCFLQHIFFAAPFRLPYAFAILKFTTSYRKKNNKSKKEQKGRCFIENFTVSVRFCSSSFLKKNRAQILTKFYEKRTETVLFVKIGSYKKRFSREQQKRIDTVFKNSCSRRLFENRVNTVKGAFCYYLYTKSAQALLFCNVHILPVLFTIYFIVFQLLHYNLSGIFTIDNI